jgi:hypothetical protein
MGKKHFIYSCILCTALSLSGYSQRSELVDVFTSQLGVREATGRNDGVSVESYLAYVGFGRGNAWCAAFVSWSHGQIGVGSPRSAWSPSLFPPKNLIYSKAGVNVRQAIPGDVFGIYFSNLGRIAHVGFIAGTKGDNYITVEGNTNDDGSREGDGVYRKIRPRKTINKISSFVDVPSQKGEV